MWWVVMTIDETYRHAEKLCLLAARNPDRWLALYNEAMAAVNKLEHNGWKRKTGMTQNQLILKHLKKTGSITQREAIVDYSIQSLTKRISELREAGHNIISHFKYHPITGQRYARYELVN